MSMSMYRFEDGSAYYHDDEREGLLRICRLSLHRKYPKFSTDGYNALYTRPPVIYLNSASRPGLAHYICAQVGAKMGMGAGEEGRVEWGMGRGRGEVRDVGEGGALGRVEGRG